MLNNYSATSFTLKATNRYKQVAFIQKEDAALNIHKKETVGVALSQKGEKTQDKIGVTCHRCQKKEHFSYECKYPAHVPQDELAVHINLEAESQEDIPDFHFLNLVEENPDSSIEASIFGDGYYSVELNNGDSLVDSLDKERNHTLLLIRNHTSFQKGSINPNRILLDTGSYIDVFCNPSLLNNIHRL